MGIFKDQIKQQGGLKIIKEYWHSGVLLYTLLQLLLVGKSKKGLEIVRLGVKLKIHQKLKKKYLPVLKRFDDSYQPSDFLQEHSNKVWVFWMQGIDKAPELVRRCYKSLTDNLTDREIILITSENIDKYVEFPSYIQRKLAEGKITYTHLSDILRMELLIKYGGTWLDSTVFCSGKDIPSYMLDSDFFVFQNLRPGDNGSVLNCSSWLMTSCTNNKMLLAVRAMMYKYWETNETLIDYFLFHHFIMIVSEYYKDEWRKIIQFPNSFPHVLLLMLFEPFDQHKWDAVTHACPFHKLAYKRSAEEMAKEDTFYKYLMR